MKSSSPKKSKQRSQSATTVAGEVTATSSSKQSSSKSSGPMQSGSMQAGSGSTAEVMTASATAAALSPRALSKAIFDADYPEQFAQALPAQALYLCVQDAGLTSSHDLLRLVHPEQMRSMLDFDLWHGDEFSEERFFEWISLVEEQDDFSVLHKVLGSVDLKLVGMLIGSYVEVITYEQPNDQPPQPGFYTPDGGQTWLHLNIQEADKHFLMARFLALIFETSRELFYQILAVPGVSTRTQLEEESYAERSKRLESIGVPSKEWAHELLSALSVKELSALVQEALRGELAVRPLPDILPVALSRSSKRSVEPLDAVLRAGLSGVEEEFTLLSNAALVVYGVNFSEYEAVKLLVEKLLGAINIGLERGCVGEPGQPVTAESAIEAVKVLGLRPFARTGFALLESIRRKAGKLSQDVLATVDPQSPEFLVIAAARERIPMLPEGLSITSDGRWEIEIVGERMSSEVRAIVHASEVAIVDQVVGLFSAAASKSA